jgi:hypothetical protein
MMNKFKAGDKVRRINDSWGNTIIGEIYTVSDHESRYLYLAHDTISYDPSNFELVEDVVESPSEQEIITAWLDKLTYVLAKDCSINSSLDINEHGGISIFGDISQITGSTDIYQYIENTYDQLKSQEIQKKSQKLLEQKEQLAKQLADIEKELESLK